MHGGPIIEDSKTNLIMDRYLDIGSVLFHDTIAGPCMPAASYNLYVF